jgi:hypothetical protein
MCLCTPGNTKACMCDVVGITRKHFEQTNRYTAETNRIIESGRLQREKQERATRLAQAQRLASASNKTIADSTATQPTTSSSGGGSLGYLAAASFIGLAVLSGGNNSANDPQNNPKQNMPVSSSQQSKIENIIKINVKPPAAHIKTRERLQARLDYPAIALFVANDQTFFAFNPNAAAAKIAARADCEKKMGVSCKFIEATKAGTPTCLGYFFKSALIQHTKPDAIDSNIQRCNF